MGGRGSAGGAAKTAANPKSAAAKTPEDSVLAAITQAGADRKAAGHGLYKGNTTPIADARALAAKAGMSSADFNRAIMNLHDQGKVQIYSSSASRLLTSDQRTGGLQYGGKQQNIVTLR